MFNLKNTTLFYYLQLPQNIRKLKSKIKCKQKLTYCHRKAIAPLEATVEQNGAFWVKRDAGCGGFVGCLKWTGSDIILTHCGEELSVVCQRALN